MEIVRAVWEVLQDLFGVGENQRGIVRQKNVSEPSTPAPYSGDSAGTAFTQTLTHITTSTNDELLQEAFSPDEAGLAAHEQVFVSVPEAAVFVHPTESFDMVYKRIPYGTTMTLTERRGRWVAVQYRDHSGWMLRDCITATRSEVWPAFSTGTVYTDTHPDTARLRACIADSFYAGGLGLPLQDVELVTYLLLCTGRTIAWPNIRPRSPGQWHHILKGVSSVHLSVLPVTGSVMEYWRTDSGIASVAFVQAVAPDESIVAAWLDERSTYHEKTLTKPEWTALQPIFIEVHQRADLLE